MPASINRVGGMLLLAFVLLAGALGLWTANGPGLVAREDNPRRILAERRILRGPILDRDGRVIIETVGQPGTYIRNSRYRHAAPFTGYYSLLYGSSGVERALDAVLRGTRDADPLQSQIDDLLHVNPVGRAVQLTIDLDVQRVADALLENHLGAMVVLSVPDGDILALSSRPTFDPNTLDEDWDALRADPTAPLVNRATQGQYQPGTALQPLVLSAALEHDAASLSDTPESPTHPLSIDAQRLTCRDSQQVITLADAFRSACPAPFADLGVSLGGVALWQVAAAWGMTDTNVLGIESRAAITRTGQLADAEALREFAAGQGDLTVTPLQMATAALVLSTRGEITSPRLVSGTQTLDATWESFASPPRRRVAPSYIIEEIVEVMPQIGNAAWHGGIGLGGDSRLLWFIGLAPRDKPTYALAVLIEQPAVGGSATEAVEIGEQLLLALNP